MMPNFQAASKGRIFTLLCFIAIPVCVLLFFTPFIIQKRTFIGDDMAIIGIPAAEYIHNMGQAGKLFLWNPYVNSGLPTVASSMGTLFYPLNVFFIFFKPADSILYYFMLHQILAGFFSFIYLRKNGFRHAPALISSLLYAFSAIRLQYSTTLEYYGILTFAPFILFALDNLADNRNIRAAAIFSIAMSFAVLCGGIQPLLLYLVLFFFYYLLKIVIVKKKEWKKAITASLAALILTIGLTAPLTATMLIELDSQGVSRRTAFDLQQISLDAVSLQTLLLIPFDNFYGDASKAVNGVSNLKYWGHVYVPGSFGLFLSMLALCLPRKRRRAVLFFLLLTIIAAFALALGTKTPLYSFLYNKLELFRCFRQPARFLFIAPLFLLYSNACGIELITIAARRLRSLSVRIRRTVASFSLLSFIFFVAYYILFVSIGSRGSIFNHTLLICTLLPILATCLVFLKASKRSAAAGSVFAFLIPVVLLSSTVLAILDPVMFIQKHLFIDNSFFYRESLFLNEIRNQLPTKYSKILYSVNPMMTQSSSVSNISASISLTVKRYEEYLFAALRGRRITEDDYRKMMYDSFHPLVMITGRDWSSSINSLENVDWTRIYQDRLSRNKMYRMLCPAFTILPTAFFKDDRPCPRFWLSRGYTVEKDSERMIDTLLANGYDPLEKVILETEPGSEAGRMEIPETRQSDPKAAITHFEPDLVRISLNGDWGWLTISDLYYPGWKARIDGKDVPVYRGNSIFRTIPVARGSRELELRYTAPAARAGLLVFTITVLLVTAILVPKRRPARSEKQSQTAI